MAAVRRLRGRESHRPGELSDAQYSLLFGLRESDAVRTSELALAADLSPASTTEMLDSLAAAGLVTPGALGAGSPRRADVADRARARARRGAPGAVSSRVGSPLSRTSASAICSQRADVLDRLRGLFDELAAERVVDDERVA